jgi:acyl-coenzyme A synthetase/AMP-(fatty) acid ligase
MALKAKLIIKEDFLPYELLKEADDKNTLVVTTPVFIKALTRLNAKQNMSSNLFISSTGPLDNHSVTTFEDNFQTNLLQLFGSTETGGIAYKFHSGDIWTPLAKIKISVNEDRLRIDSPFVSKYLLDKDIHSIHSPFQTEDIVELSKDGFVLLGRSNKIIKIAGKRISAVQIENILESIDGVKKAIVEIIYKKELLRSEQILITLESETQIPSNQIKHKISEYYGTLTIPFKVNYVDQINLSAMGKKMKFKNQEENE